MKIVYLSLEENIELEQYHDILYINYKTENPLQKIAEFKPDILIEREFNDRVSRYVDIVSFVAKEFPQCKKAVWLIDSHCNMEWHQQYYTNFDYVFVAVSRFLPSFKGDNVFHLPLCYPERSDSITATIEPKSKRIVFVGTMNRFFTKRLSYIKFLSQNLKRLFYSVTDRENMANIVSSSIGSFNCSLDRDMNFRVFETMALGTELITDDVTDLHKITGLAKRIYIYQNKKQLLNICRNVLNKPVSSRVLDNKIWVKENHCLIHRHLDMLEMMETGIQKTW